MTRAFFSRDSFRDAVFTRDAGRCVLCHALAVDAHHIIERRLFDDGTEGYYVDNGASVCEPCHLRCESTEITVEEVRAHACIVNVIVPPGFTAADQIDKWGNQILPNGMRMRGPLYDDAGCQRSLLRGGFLGSFTSWVKHPRTAHLPWSPGMTSDDKRIEAMSLLETAEVVVTVKLDGENTTMYRDGLHARSLNTSGGPERDIVKALHGQIAHDIPEDMRICGENLHARHSIAYSNLDAYFFVHSVWSAGTCLSWDDTTVWAGLLGLPTVPVLYRGRWDETVIRNLYKPIHAGDECEGYVVRPARTFRMADFHKVVAKYVRKNHVTSSDHWKHEALVPNKLRTT